MESLFDESDRELDELLLEVADVLELDVLDTLVLVELPLVELELSDSLDTLTLIELDVEIEYACPGLSSLPRTHSALVAAFCVQ